MTGAGGFVGTHLVRYLLDEGDEVVELERNVDGIDIADAEPIAEAFDLPVTVDDRLVEADNHFEGLTFGMGAGSLRRPEHSWHLRNPFRPSWGEPYMDLAARMRAAVIRAREAACGREAVCVSHQLPIWVTRLHVEGRSFVHDPRKRQCTLCSLTSLHFVGDRLTQVSYSEPAGDLIPTADKNAPFSAGNAPEERRP